jgi:uncharacterized protein (TIGR02266 family)
MEGGLMKPLAHPSTDEFTIDESSGVRRMTPDPLANQPVSARLRLDAELSLTSESQFFSDLSGDIAEGGLFVATYRHIALGTVVDLDLAFPDGSVTAIGRVRWVRPVGFDLPPGLGLELVALSEGVRKRIEHFCRVRPPLYYEE